MIQEAISDARALAAIDEVMNGWSFRNCSAGPATIVSHGNCAPKPVSASKFESSIRLHLANLLGLNRLCFCVFRAQLETGRGA